MFVLSKGLLSIPITSGLYYFRCRSAFIPAKVQSPFIFSDFCIRLPPLHTKGASERGTREPPPSTYGHTTTAMHDIEYTPSPSTSSPPAARPHPSLPHLSPSLHQRKARGREPLSETSTQKKKTTIITKTTNTHQHHQPTYPLTQPPTHPLTSLSHPTQNHPTPPTPRPIHAPPLRQPKKLHWQHHRSKEIVPRRCVIGRGRLWPLRVVQIKTPPKKHGGAGRRERPNRPQSPPKGSSYVGPAKVMVRARVGVGLGMNRRSRQKQLTTRCCTSYLQGGVAIRDNPTHPPLCLLNTPTYSNTNPRTHPYPTHPPTHPPASAAQT